MRIFTKLYDMTLRWSRHRRAPWFLAGMTFAESSFFPIPPDVMLAPMVLADRRRTWFLASLTTFSSVLGAVLGYLIGMFLFEQLGQPVIDFYHAQEAFATVKQWFSDYGVWVIFIAGFTPIPYKLFTITAGVLVMAMIPFILASVVGRGARFFLVAGLLYWGGEKFEAALRKHIDTIGWITVALVAIGIGLHSLLK